MNLQKIITVGPDGTLIFDSKSYRCVLGKRGVVKNKTEGDNSTPSGVFPLRELYFRSDKIPKPKTFLETYIIKPNDGWCDDPNHPDYNKKIVFPHRGRAEPLWRSDSAYDILIVIGYNDEPVKKPLGSAIFLHVAKQGSQHTRGCIALDFSDLCEVVENLTPDTRIEVLPPP